MTARDQMSERENIRVCNYVCMYHSSLGYCLSQLFSLVCSALLVPNSNVIFRKLLNFNTSSAKWSLWVFFFSQSITFVYLLSSLLHMYYIHCFFLILFSYLLIASFLPIRIFFASNTVILTINLSISFPALLHILPRDLVNVQTWPVCHDRKKALTVNPSFYAQRWRLSVCYPASQMHSWSSHMSLYFLSWWGICFYLYFKVRIYIYGF